MTQETILAVSILRAVKKKNIFNQLWSANFKKVFLQGKNKKKNTYLFTFIYTILKSYFALSQMAIFSLPFTLRPQAQCGSSKWLIFIFGKTLDQSLVLESKDIEVKVLDLI